MKNITILFCIFGLLSIVSVHADKRCYKFGIGANKELKHTQCHCNCDRHPSAGRGKCSECGHFRAPTVYSSKNSQKLTS